MAANRTFRGAASWTAPVEPGTRPAPPPGYKGICSACGAPQNRNKAGLCGICHMAQWRAVPFNRAKERARILAWNRAHPERQSQWMRTAHRRRIEARTTALPCWRCTILIPPNPEGARTCEWCREEVRLIRQLPSAASG